jgi:hypothetical protein
LNYSAIAMMVLDGKWPEVQDNDWTTPSNLWPST